MSDRIEIDGQRIDVGNPEKLLFPGDGISKLELVEYYHRVAETMLPHVRQRPVTMHRFPDGVDEGGFYQKEAPGHFPDWIRTETVSKEGGSVTHVVIEDAATIVYLAEQACITPHVWLSRVEHIETPDRVVFDLDPPEGDDELEPVRFAARRIRSLLDDLGLQSRLMTTGSNGFHVVVPVDESLGFGDIRDFAQRCARLLAERHPDALTVEQRVDARGERVFLDYLRNSYAQTTVAPYGVRALPQGPVATPIDWSELSEARPRSYTIHNLFRRLGQKTDPWANDAIESQSISRAVRRLEDIEDRTRTFVHTTQTPFQVVVERDRTAQRRPRREKRRRKADMRKSHTSAVMVALLATVLTAIPSAAAQELAPGGTFVDDDGNPHEPRIEAIAAQGITEGCNAALGLYCPDAAVTRGQMATFLARALGDQLAAATQDWFPDDDGSVHEPNIDIIAENGITVGYPNGNFGPADLVTRGQMASFLVRALDGLDPATRDWFTDDDGSVHEDDIDVIAENGITIGYDDGTFRPEANIARDEMATMLVRGLELTAITPPPRIAVSAYFLMAPTGEDPSGSGPFLAPVARAVAEPLAPAMPTMQSLLSGPTGDESSGTPAIMSEIPSGTEVLGLTIADGVATIDLSAEFESGGGSFSMLARVAQVVFTLTQFPTVDEVDFEIEGTAIEVLGGEGIVLDSYDTRQELIVGTDLLPAIFVDVPAYGGTVDDPIRVIGWTGVFEAQFVVTVTDGDGLIITEQSVLAQGDQVTESEGRTWTAFDITVDYDVETWQLGALIVFDTSARDGSQVGVREYPILLKPSG